MNEEFLIHDVLSGESLSTIAEKIGMTDVQLRDFHNENCRKVNLPWFYTFLGIQKIVIPKNYKSPEQLWNEISEKLPPQSLQPGMYEEKYVIQETFEQIGEEKMEHEYFLALNLKEIKESLIAEIKQSGHTINQRKPDKKTSNLGMACMEAIYPIQIPISNKGEMSVVPTEDLKKKFESKRIEIEEFYTDDISKKYLDNFQKELGKDGHFYQQFRSTLLYQLMFPDFELFWKKEKFVKELFVILNSFPIQCEFLPHHQINEDLININFSGKIIENCTLSELLQNVRDEDDEDKNRIIGQVNFRYVYNSKNKKFTDAEAEILVWNDDDLYLQHKLKISKDE
ncbi:hypothetical protein [Chryseobacterium sp. c4a]|uniref:hypothetical protein n=1 Tax=Chryseobacterium sp. c4a TaxID=1573582 RepID=UPI00135B85E5|nr:hypothetical protein [Chryseobacterium sp. c4a]